MGNACVRVGVARLGGSSGGMGGVYRSSRSACAAGAVRAAHGGLATRLAGSPAQSAAGRQASDSPDVAARLTPQRLTFSRTQRATTFEQPQTASLTGIASVLSLCNCSKLVLGRRFSE